MDDVLTEMRLATESLDHLAATQRRHNAAVDKSIADLWNDQGELRDALLALANRIEANTRTPFTEATNADA